MRVASVAGILPSFYGYYAMQILPTTCTWGYAQSLLLVEMCLLRYPPRFFAIDDAVERGLQ